MQKTTQIIVVGVTACLIGVVGTLAIVFGTGLVTSSDNKRTESVDLADFESTSIYDPTDYEHLVDYEYFSQLHLTLSELSFFELIESLGTSQRLSNTARRFETQQAIVRKLVYLDPEEALANVSLLPDSEVLDLIPVVFAAWSHVDHDAALKKASVLAPNLKSLAWQGLMLSNEDIAFSEQIRIAESLDLDILTDDNVNQSDSIAIGDYENSWNTLIHDELPDYVQVQELLSIAESWFDKEGFAAIDRVRDGLNGWAVKQVIVGSLLYHSALKDREGTFEYALSLVGGDDTYFVSSFFQRWARTAPKEILDLVSTLDNRGNRQHLQSTILSTWADVDPYALLDEIESLPIELQLKATEAALVSLAISEPKSVISYLPSLDNRGSQRQVARALVNSWAEKDALAALDWVLTDPFVDEISYRQSLLQPVLYFLARTNPDLAMDTALDQPLGRSRVGAEAHLIGSLSWRNLDTAIKLLPRTREGNTRLNAYQSVGFTLLMRGEIDRAFSLGNDLPENNLDKYQYEIIERWAHRDHSAVYDNISRLRSKKLQSIAAYMLISNQRNRMTNEQLREVANYLTDDQRHRLRRTLSTIES
ncbi:MAG: hypothetical protein OXH84_04575 [Gammaproteobacteria bacterium]|nr:hypothetical protein [Gammaproteobacteria bacterium]